MAIRDLKPGLWSKSRRNHPGSQALGEAALISDWDEARFRSVRINDLAFALGFQRVAQAARDVTRALGPTGHTPQPGYGAAVDTLSLAINRLL